VPKILFCATVDYHFQAFHLPVMKWFHEQGWIVDVAAFGNLKLPYTNHQYHIPIQRTPYHFSNWRAYKELKNIVAQNKYDIIHCHTPLGGVVGRLSAIGARKKGTKIIYTAHGFHFYKGAPIRNWLTFYPIEKLLSRYTDHLITINNEDYLLATRKKFKAKAIDHVHGVGVDVHRFKPVDKNRKEELKKSFGYHANDFLLFYAAEMNQNKNQAFLIRTIELLKNKIPQVKLILAGDGPLLEDCQKLANQLGVSHMVDFLGLRQDIDQILPMCDIAVASSLREGLPVNIMEAMACGLPVIAVDNRGHRELIQNNKNGWLIRKKDIVQFAVKINQLAENEEVRKILGEAGRKIVLAKYSTSKVLEELKRIYKKAIDRKEESDWAVR
jgi:glycosyltransferase EpsD